jgi:hypothetical protein
MKITKAHLRRLIKEELQTIMEAPHDRTNMKISRDALAKTVDGRDTSGEIGGIKRDMQVDAGVLSKLKSMKRYYPQSPIPFSAASSAMRKMVRNMDFGAEAFDASLPARFGDMYTDERNKGKLRAPWYDKLERWAEKVSGGVDSEINYH